MGTQENSYILTFGNVVYNKHMLIIN
jgi:hypothetical protein